MYEKTGYLTEPLKLFYVSDKRDWACPVHYHEFDKVMLFFQGDVTYEIEGKSYRLQPYDIVVVPAGQMHRPVVGGAYTYERIIAYISPAYIESYRQRGCDLSALFQTASPILRQPQEAGSLYGASCRLRQAYCTEAGAQHAVLTEALFLEFLIYLAQSIQERHIGYVKTGQQNEKIQRLLTYINEHLRGELSVPVLAEQLCISPDYLMHLFKEETGYSLGQYITIKRLLLARSLMQQDRPLTEVCYDSGFKQYSTFYRAWKKYYGASPAKGIPPQTRLFLE